MVLSFVTGEFDLHVLVEMILTPLDINLKKKTAKITNVIKVVSIGFNEVFLA